VRRGRHRLAYAWIIRRCELRTQKAPGSARNVAQTAWSPATWSKLIRHGASRHNLAEAWPPIQEVVEAYITNPKGNLSF